ncbi:MAG: sugar ABC transporter substrate-binding protein [Alphaproteobacteria bacterium]
MKRFAIALLAAFMIFAAAERGNAQEKESVAMSFGGSTIALWNDIIEIMEPALAEQGYNLVTHDPQFRVEQQVQDWKSWIAQRKVKAIMGWPINADAMIPVTRQAQEAGIPVIGYAVSWQGVSAALLTTPEEDGRQLATYAIDWIKQNYGDAPVEVAVISDEQNDLTRLRVEGIYKGVTEAVPNATVYKVPALTREDGFNAAKQQLTAHPNTTVWLSYSNDNMKGVYKALTDSGIAKDDPKYFLAGMDVTNEDLDLIQIPNSIYRMAFAFRSETLAKVNMDFLVAAAKGEELKDVYVRPELVTPETAKNFYVGNVRH